MNKPKLYANRDHTADTYCFTTNLYSKELIDRCKSVLETLTGIDVSTTVLVRRAVYSLVMELAKTTDRLGKNKDVVSALENIRDREACLLVHLAGRDVTTRDYRKK